MFIDQTWSSKLNTKCAEWDKRYFDWFMALPLTERPLTTLEYLTKHGSVSGDPEKQAAYNLYMKEAQQVNLLIRQRYIDEVEPYPVKRFK